MRHHVHRRRLRARESLLGSNRFVLGGEDGNHVIVCDCLRLFWWVNHRQVLLNSIHYFPTFTSWNASNFNQKRRRWNLLNILPVRSFAGAFRSTFEVHLRLPAFAAFRNRRIHRRTLVNSASWNAWHQAARHHRGSRKYWEENSGDGRWRQLKLFWWLIEVEMVTKLLNVTSHRTIHNDDNRKFTLNNHNKLESSTHAVDVTILPSRDD